MIEFLRGAEHTLHNPCCSPRTSRATKKYGVNYIPPGLGISTVKIFCIVLTCSIAGAWLQGEKKDSLGVELSLKGYFPSDQEDDDKVFLAQPMALARNANGDFYVYDHKSNMISIFDSEGKFISKTGKRGQGPGEFLFIRRILPEGDNLVILDSMRHEICYLNCKGQYLNSFKVFRSYSDFAIDHKGRIYCVFQPTTVNPFLVDVIDESGKLLYSFGTPIRKFNNVKDSFLNDAKIVCDGNCITLLFTTIALIQQYDLDGKLIHEWSFEEFPRIKKREKENLIKISEMIPGRTPIGQLSAAICYENGSYYVLQNIKNGLEIIKLNSALGYEKNFIYKDVTESFYLAFDIVVENEGQKPIFYVDIAFPYARIEVISPR